MEKRGQGEEGAHLNDPGTTLRVLPPTLPWYAQLYLGAGRHPGYCPLAAAPRRPGRTRHSEWPP